LPDDDVKNMWGAGEHTVEAPEPDSMTIDNIHAFLGSIDEDMVSDIAVDFNDESDDIGTITIKIDIDKSVNYYRQAILNIGKIIKELREGIDELEVKRDEYEQRIKDSEKGREGQGE